MQIVFGANKTGHNVFVGIDELDKRVRRRHDLTPGHPSGGRRVFRSRARIRSPRTAGQARRRRCRRRAGFARARRRRSIAYGQQNGKRNRSAKTHIDTADYVAAAVDMNE